MDWNFYMAIWKSLRFQIWMVCFSLGVSFNEMKHILASSDKVDCCHFSSDGKLFVTGGRDKKVYSGSIQLLIMKWSLFSNVVIFSVCLKKFLFINLNLLTCYEMQASLWCTKLFNLKSTLEEHTQRITDVRFSPCMFYVATSSADKTVKVWDVNNVSLDFHDSTSIL